jgi:hypothetical protein
MRPNIKVILHGRSDVGNSGTPNPNRSTSS